MKRNQWLVITFLFPAIFASGQQKRTTEIIMDSAIKTAGSFHPLLFNRTVIIGNFNSVLNEILPYRKMLQKRAAFKFLAAPRSGYSSQHFINKANHFTVLHNFESEVQKTVSTSGITYTTVVKKYSFSDSQHPMYGMFLNYKNAYPGSYPSAARSRFGYTKGEKAMMMLGTIMDAVQPEIIHSLARSRFSRHP